MWPIIQRVWITLGLTFTVVFVAWSLIAYRADAEARVAVRSDARVEVARMDDGWTFVPAEGSTPGAASGSPPGAASGSPARAALLFFPGALVDPLAYAPLARAVAEAGYVARIIELPRRGAFGGADSPEVEARVRSALASLPDSTRVVLGGHSRGAVVASRIAYSRPPWLGGLVLIGTSHPRDHDLSGLRVPVAKIVGTRDGLATTAEVEANAALLPPHTRWVRVEGGNHSQFGWYGFQPLDRRPRVSAADQRRAMIEAVLELLADVAAPEQPDAGVGARRELPMRDAR